MSDALKLAGLIYVVGLGLAFYLTGEERSLTKRQQVALSVYWPIVLVSVVLWGLLVSCPATLIRMLRRS